MTERAKDINEALRRGTLDLTRGIPMSANGTAVSMPAADGGVTGRRAFKLIALTEMITRMRPVGQRMPTGFETLDSATRGGLPLGRFVVLTGAPGAAKTGLATYMLHRLEQLGCACAFLAADEPADAVVVRLGQLSGWSRDALEREGEEGSAARAMFAQGVVGRMIAVVDPDDANAGSLTIEDVHAALVEFAGQEPRVLVVDSLQTAACAAAAGSETARERMDAKIAVLKSIAKTGTLVFAISEMSRGGYRSGNQAFDTSALAASKESGSIEYGASLLLGLRSVKGLIGQIDVEVAKNRLGNSKPKFRLRLDFDTACFTEIAMPDSLERRSSNDRVRNAAATDRVREAVRKHRNLKSINKILAVCTGNRTDNHHAIQALEVTGELQKVGGTYRLCTENEEGNAAE